MDDADRKMWGTIILVSGLVGSFAMWRGAMYYYGADKGKPVSPAAYEAMMEERVRQANAQAESGEGYDPSMPRTVKFTGTLTPDQQQQILTALSPHRGCIVSIRPAQGSEGSSVSTSGSKAPQNTWPVCSGRQDGTPASWSPALTRVRVAMAIPTRDW